MNMWPLTERRRSGRYVVDWNASLRCTFSHGDEIVPARIVEISLTGAQLSLERLQIGSYHLTIGDTPAEISISVSLPQAEITIPIEIKWYNWDENRRAFLVGVEFYELSTDDKSLLKQAFKTI